MLEILVKSEGTLADDLLKLWSMCLQPLDLIFATRFYTVFLVFLFYGLFGLPLENAN